MSRSVRQRKGGGVRDKFVIVSLLAVVFVLATSIVLMHVSAQSKASSLVRKADVRTAVKAPLSYKKPLKPTHKTVAGPFFYLFIVLDDAGAADEQLQPFYAFPEFDKLTFAILPHLADTQSVAHALAAKNTSYVLHMPMQPRGAQDPGPFALCVKYSEQEIAKLTEQNMQNIPHIIGVNNHMGSAATESYELMHTLLIYIKNQGLFFMDSRTSEKSVASEVADRVGVPFITRDIFLDNEENINYITQQLQKAAMIARDRGFAVAIGHVTKSTTAQALISAYQNMKAQGILFASLREYFSYIH